MPRWRPNSSASPEVSDEDQPPLDVEGPHHPLPAPRRMLVSFDSVRPVRRASVVHGLCGICGAALPTIVLAGSPRWDRAGPPRARRFTWLIDVMYDARVKMILSAAVMADKLYTQGALAHEFTRTVNPDQYRPSTTCASRGSEQHGVQEWWGAGG